MRLAAAGESVRSIGEGFRLPFDGGRLLLRERGLWLPALVPVLLSCAAFGAAVALVVTQAGALHELATGWMPALPAPAWYAWLWVGPGRLLLALLGLALFLAMVAMVLVAAYLTASLLAAPFHDWLSQRVERLLTGGLDDRASPGLAGVLGDALRSLREELRRLLFFLAVVGPLALLGFLLPFAQVVTGPAILAFTVFFLPLDYASYTLDRRRLNFAQKRRWLLDRGPLTAGFGGAAFLTCSIPLLNLLAMPVLVVAGTLFALRQEPPVRAGDVSGAAPRGRATSP